MESNFRVAAINYIRTDDGLLEKNTTTSLHVTFEDAKKFMENITTFSKEPMLVRIDMLGHFLINEECIEKKKMDWYRRISSYAEKEEFEKLEKEYNLQKK